MLKLTGSLEQKVINILWESGKPLKPIDVKNDIKEELSYSTIKTVLGRLFEKGLLIRKKDGNAFAYFPKVSKEDFASKNLKNVLQNLLDSYGPLVISQFVETIKDNKENKDLLKKYLDENS